MLYNEQPQDEIGKQMPEEIEGKIQSDKTLGSS